MGGEMPGVSTGECQASPNSHRELGCGSRADARRWHAHVPDRKAIKAPQPWTSIMPTGGVSPTHENLEKWFSAGVTCVGMGSKLIQKKDNGDFDLDKITALTKEALQIIKSVRT